MVMPMASGGGVDLVALQRSLAIDDPLGRSRGVLRALAWDRPGAEVEWAPVDQIGRFTIGGFPTSSSVVPTPDKARTTAWHAGYRVCLSASRGELHWFDLHSRTRWQCLAGNLTLDVLEGLTAESFARTGRLSPTGVTPEVAQELFPRDPSAMLADRMRRWWESYCTFSLSGASRKKPTEDQKDTFTRFISGVLLLRTIEDTERVPWLRHGTLLETAIGDSTRTFPQIVAEAAAALNSRVLSRIASVPPAIANTIIEESYSIGVNFASLDVDPVGSFYEEILGVEYSHEEHPQQEMFGRSVVTTADRSARRAHGVYYTPRIYADTMARVLVRPRVRTAETHDELPVIADIAAGSGELLCAALRELLSEPKWRDPNTVWNILDHKLQAIDKNPLALQLCALNILRTAVRHLPELFDGTRQLPSLESNLRCGDALVTDTIAAVPAPDVVLINPPFHAVNRWKRPDPSAAIPELSEVPSHPHAALAFFAAAVRLARPDASIGVIVPSNVLTGSQSASWRTWLAERVRLDLVVANYGTPFRDIHSFAGLVTGRKLRDGSKRPRTRVVRIEGSIKDEDFDTGVLLSEARDARRFVSSRIIKGIDGDSNDWLGGRRPDVIIKQGRAQLSDVFGDSFHQGVVLAPEPWKRELFLFRRSDAGTLVHELTGEDLGSVHSERLRPFVTAKQVSGKVALWCEPAVENSWVFVPPAGPDGWCDVDQLRSTDADAWTIARAVVKAILAVPASSAKQSAEFVRRAGDGQLRFSWLKGFRDAFEPLVYASKASPSSTGQGRGTAWYAWVNLDGDAVPVSGLQLRVRRPEFAAALVSWMSVDAHVQQLRSVSAARIGGSVQFDLSAVAQWPVPDLRDDSVQGHLDQLYATFLEYREEAQEMTPASAASLASYREVQALGSALWTLK